jgi:hypothetical protein
MVPVTWREEHLPPECWEAIRRLDMLAWRAVFEDLQTRYRVSPDLAQKKMPRVVYVAYHHGAGTPVARKLVEKLREKNLTSPWFDRTEMGFADDIRATMKEGIEAASMSVVVYTEDFWTGGTTPWEHEQLVKKAQESPGFLMGYVLVDNAALGKDARERPRAHDYLYGRLANESAANFDSVVDTIWRAVWGLPQQAP